MAVASPATALSPLAVSSPKVEGPLAALSNDWRRGSVQLLPILHALWAGDRGAAAAAAAAGAVSVAAELGTKGTDAAAKETPQGATQPLDTWAWKIADKLRRDVRETNCSSRNEKINSSKTGDRGDTQKETAKKINEDRQIETHTNRDT